MDQEFELSDGQKLLVEIERDSIEEAGIRGVLDGDVKKLREAIAPLSTLYEDITSSLKSINEPSEISIEVGIKLSAKAGIVIVSGDSEANFKLSITWKNELK
ncbi:CU044_2847 family protein [Teredinibacter turnerae]|uniref:CU044_2847 family protein n=1 Tax=Teredinibacter turnerae TaxID=2426 RepID=UPI00035C5E31|nr:CU044_2847 family protein [Teredinibacter turnerae]